MPTQRNKLMEDTKNGDVLGDRIRQLRKRRRMTLDALAAVSGLSAGYVSLIERNLADPSINALIAIARTLGVTVEWFFAGPSVAAPEEAGYVVRQNNRLSVRYAQGIVDELLTPKFNLQLEMIHSRFPPGTEAQSSYSHEGEEVGFVLEGQLELWVGERHFILNVGDSCSFSSSEPHRYRNSGDVEAIVIWAISPPSF